jgi:hypothetical protein
MNRTFAMVSWACTLVLTVGCGDGGSGRSSEELATAARGVTHAAESASALAAAQMLSVDKSIVVQGQTGTAEVTFQINVDTQPGVEVQHAAHIVFNQYSPDGRSTYDGEIDYVQSVSVGQPGVHVIHSVKGALVITGEDAGSYIFDFTQSVEVGQTSAGQGVAVVMKGSITVDGQTRVFDHEVIVVGR